MASYKFVVFSNPTEGRESEYNRWYDEVHLGEVLEVPGFIAASRLRLEVGPGDDAPEFAYLAIYEMETDDPGAVLRDLKERAGEGRLDMSDALENVSTSLYREITPRRTG